MEQTRLMSTETNLNACSLGPVLTDSDASFAAGPTDNYIRFDCDPRKGDRLTRFYDAVAYLREAIDKVDGPYMLRPVMIAKNVSGSVLEQVPSAVVGFHVKCVVIDRCLYITNLSWSDAHGRGVPVLIGMTNSWNSLLLFHACTNGAHVSKDGHSASAVDLELIVPRLCASAELGPGRAFAAELEASNRRARQLREDYAAYFAEPTLCTFVAIKMFGDATCPAMHAIAVQWVRDASGNIVVADVADFGILPITAAARKDLAQELPGALPPVDAGLWAGRRFVPVPASVADPVLPQAEYVQVCNAYLQSMPAYIALEALYPHGAPTLTVDKSALMASLHNLPSSAPGLSDCVIELRRVFCVACQ